MGKKNSISADSGRRADVWLFWDRKENYPKVIISSLASLYLTESLAAGIS
jgi:hypothetical protein